ncbi:MAG: DUF349 domain-containing protein [Muribaculaceae bacterium]|nr:DUF349 domain-containing protein [Muribaculaceae bacterium]
MESLEKVSAPENQVVDPTLAPEAPSVAPVESETLEETSATQEEPVRMDDVMNRLRELAASDGEIITTDEIGRLKQQFYSLVNESMAVQRDEFIAAGNDPEAFNPVPVAEEPEFKDLMAKVKEVKALYRERVEAEQLRNLERKNAIISELMSMADDTDNVNRHYPRAKELQVEFKEIGEVPQQNTTQIWKAFQEAVEHFYDQWKVNKELRDYDFKKNLSEKQLLIDEAKALTTEEDVVIAFRRLQELHEKWRETGPVAKEIREEIWQEFKDASAEINKRYQAFFEERKQREQANEAAKTTLCERIEAITPDTLTSYSAWNKATETIMEAQKEWKTLGYASRKANNQLFSRFRATCDAFFAAKGEFFKTMKNNLAENLAAKTKLCEQAEALAASTEWRKTSDELVELQKKWRSIGAVPKKHSDQIWQRFMTACNTFFDNKKHATTDVRRTEQANLKVKKSIVAELTVLNAPDAAIDRAEAIEKINALRARWQETGHVPFKEKDKLHDTYREVVRQLFDKYDVHEKRQRMDSFQSSIDAISSDRAKLLRERDRMMRAYESRKSELATYENNLSFLSARSRSGASMLGEIERNIGRLKNSLKELEEKIQLIDGKLA